MVSNADTPRARALGVELRQAREANQLSTRRLGELIGRDGSHISRWENGKLIPTEADTATVLAVLGVTGDERERLLALARDALDPNWVAPGVDKQLAALGEYERTAKHIMNVEPLLIPGLMQTAEYARAVMVEFGATRGDADQRATHRLGRQHVLTKSRPVSMATIIGEYALRYPPCAPDIMAEQLRHLMKLSALDNVAIQVLPLDQPSAPALMGPWSVIEFHRAKAVLHLEHYSSSVTLTDEKTLTRYRDAADTLRGMAMSEEESIRLIVGFIREQETEHEHTAAE